METAKNGKIMLSILIALENSEKKNNQKTKQKKNTCVFAFYQVGETIII